MKQQPHQVHVIGASGRSGQALCHALVGQDIGVVPVVRNVARFKALSVSPLVADLTDPAALKAALAGASHIVSCAHARFAGAILDAAPPDATFVFLGSTRKFSRWPDEHGNGVRLGESAFLSSRRCGVILHPTMIYGASGENNVQRLASLLRRLPIVPLPNAGRSLLQPIYQADVTRSVLAALTHNWSGPHVMVIAGPQAVSYADFVRAVAQAAGLRPPQIMSLPAWLLQSLAPLLRFIPRMPHVSIDEIKRLLEDKNFEITAMRDILQVEPVQLAQGLSLTFQSHPK
ncbi:MAG: NADH-ubiquinone oxidoreductase [Acidocella sp. 20-57-95]|nr:MAG: NADH-ubiquinone oxidoreductase [Acidocella sp. 20-57-95]HQT64478.1 NAD(P)H-binding protein [Acidocella sp.]HQU04836.1 NAD(P)H-binding protein [Acidocella sp.]